jgi:hypothetical protein
MRLRENTYVILIERYMNEWEPFDHLHKTKDRVKRIPLNPGANSSALKGYFDSIIIRMTGLIPF